MHAPRLAKQFLLFSSNIVLCVAKAHHPNVSIMQGWQLFANFVKMHLFQRG
jgi:hypothetical protein